MRTIKLLRNFFIGVTIFFVATIMFLEIGSNYYKCPITHQSTRSELLCNSTYYPVNPNKSQTIQRIIKLKQQGIEPSREDLDQAINLLKYEDMPGLNGIACWTGMIFIRDNLSNEGKYFVARHEMEHFFIRNGMDKQCSQEEFCATINAAEIYPAGFVETILSSLYIKSKESPTIWCFLFGSWKIFRTYIFAW